MNFSSITTEQNKTIAAKLVIASIFVAIAIGGRMALLGYPNIETLMALSIVAGALLGYRYGLFVALASVIGSDMLIGNTNILLFTWSAWAAIGVVSHFAKRTNKNSVKVWADTLRFTGFGLAGTLFFYAWTNFGVWQLSGIYAPTAAGLVESYVMALPFLLNQLLGNMLIVPAVSLVVLTAWKYVPVLYTQLSGKSVQPSSAV